jgi:hypothetical protein
VQTTGDLDNWARSAPPAHRLRFDLQVLQRLGVFVNFFSAKKLCSFAEKTNSAPQSAHMSFRSVNPGTSVRSGGKH